MLNLKRRGKKKGKKKNVGMKIIDEDYDWKKAEQTSLAIEIDRAKAAGATIVTFDEAVKKQEEDEEEMIFRQAKLRQATQDGSGWVSVNDGAGGEDQSVPQRVDSDDDDSPVRRRHDSDAEDAEDDKDASKTRLDSDDDQSPERRAGGHGRHDSDDDMSPVRRSGRSARHDSDDDMSPVRRGTRHDSDDESPVRRSSKARIDSDDDMSPVRRKDRDSSPPRRRGRDDDDMSAPRRKRPRVGEDDLSPKRRRSRRDSPDDDDDLSPVRKKSSRHDDSDDEQEEKEAMGLLTSKQFTAQNLKKEAKKMKELHSMDAAASGAGAKTVFRDRRGRKLESLQKFMDQKAGKYVDDDEANIEWGSGLVQKEEREREKKMAEQLRKGPFARGRDDELMNAHLRARDRWGDPMLAMIKKKKQKKKKKQIQQQTEESSEAPAASQVKTRPYYQGHPWPNRYGIRPGYRWDGVDRSNGWESKRMLHANNMKVREQQGYRWGASAM